ncbi:MAG: DNA-processing protein DprA, partial [Candidatus Omnitrophota bacterium]|nr:DNA-processing protein DprA [Candidatus Omnitrophota bacterium]
MTELEALLVLNAIPGVSPRQIKTLLGHLGSANNVLAFCEQGTTDAFLLPSATVDYINQFPKEEFLRNEYDLLKKGHVQLISWQHEQYPASLKEIADAPLVFYYKGALPQHLAVGLAIVGSRRASVYGMLTAERFASQLAEYGIPVVSGLAKGIDTAAHRGCLKAKGATVAVLGCGLNHIYPAENKNLYEEIAASGGAVISEFSMQTPPFAYNFPRRNRIISGLCLGVIVVEAAEKSGALITADFAL